jgi:hypothetical protein
MKYKRLAGAVVTLVIGSFALGYSVSRARAAGVPAAQALTYSGVLTDGAGNPLPGPKNIEVQLYDAATAGNMLCSVGPASVPLTAGAFQVALPGSCASAIHADPDVWVDVFVEGASVGRSKLGAVPYALEADTASNAAGALATKVAAIPTISQVTTGFVACQPVTNFRTAGATNILVRASLYSDSACTVGANDPQTCHPWCAGASIRDPVNFTATCCGVGVYYTKGTVDVISYQ